ncbi:MAG: hypothetical protein JNK72_02505 [Myxococcales bacterium]|nr:hypothetical protein [Myxococcales bacterium]
MAKVQSPLLGYNTNVRYRGRVFHVQTEDSGVTKPHVITHLFADGGRIIKSQKTAYAELLEHPDLQGQVKKLMQDQHKAMLLSLRSGEHDAMIGFEAETAAFDAAATQEIDAAAVLAEVATMTPAKPAAPVAPGASAALETPTVPNPPFVGLGTPTAPGAPVPTPMATSGATPGAGLSRSGPKRRNSEVIPLPATTPAQIFRAPWAERAAPNWGDGVVSERSLDEVILSFLAREVEP